MPKPTLANCVRCGKPFYRIYGMFGRKICPECRMKAGEHQDSMGNWIKPAKKQSFPKFDVHAWDNMTVIHEKDGTECMVG